MLRPVSAIAAFALLFGCAPEPAAQPIAVERPAGSSAASGANFPTPLRPVADVVSDQYASEDERERRGEAEAIFALLGVRPGLVVADIGAGRGYHTVRLAPLVAPGGKVIATDLYQTVLDRLERRAAAAGLDNVETLRGAPDDPRLPKASVDLVILGRMYHEIKDPYAFTWRLRDALRPGGRLAIFEGDRPTNRHGTPPSLLRCELLATGWRETAFHTLDGIDPDGYLAVFEPLGERPAPEAIRPCAP